MKEIVFGIAVAMLFVVAFWSFVIRFIQKAIGPMLRKEYTIDIAKLEQLCRRQKKSLLDLERETGIQITSFKRVSGKFHASPAEAYHMGLSLGMSADQVIRETQPDNKEVNDG